MKHIRPIFFLFLNVTRINPCLKKQRYQKNCKWLTLLWKHCLVAHEGQRVEFSMKVVGNFHSCLVRQVNEGVRIKRSRAELMNSKAEFHQHPVVRVVPTQGLQNEPGEQAGGGRGGQGGRGQARARGVGGWAGGNEPWAPVFFVNNWLSLSDFAICCFLWLCLPLEAWKRSVLDPKRCQQ